MLAAVSGPIVSSQCVKYALVVISEDTQDITLISMSIHSIFVKIKIKKFLIDKVIYVRPSCAYPFYT